MPLDDFVRAITTAPDGEERCFILDTGFDIPMGATRLRQVRRSPAVGPNAVGVVPEAVRPVIPSHLHDDECETHDLSPRARCRLHDPRPPARHLAAASGLGGIDHRPDADPKET